MDDGAERTGMLHGDALAEAYRTADLFVLPSTTDTLGLVLLEALASGLPVLAAESPAARTTFSGTTLRPVLPRRPSRGPAGPRPSAAGRRPPHRSEAPRRRVRLGHRDAPIAGAGRRSRARARTSARGEGRKIARHTPVPVATFIRCFRREPSTVERRSRIQVGPVRRQRLLQLVSAGSSPAPRATGVAPWPQGDGTVADLSRAHQNPAATTSLRHREIRAMQHTDFDNKTTHSRCEARGCFLDRNRPQGGFYSGATTSRRARCAGNGYFH
nr:glycosyltransferase [Amycolatopsis sp. FDAARGOS 1241]